MDTTNARSVNFSIAAPSPAAVANIWCFPGAMADPRTQSVTFGGETGTAVLYYMGIGVGVAHGDAVATVQAALNNTTTGWGQIGVVVTVTGAAGNFLVTFNQTPGNLLPEWIFPDFSALSGAGAAAFVRGDQAWLCGGIVHGIVVDADFGSSAFPTVSVLNSRKNAAAGGKPVYLHTSTAMDGLNGPQPEIRPPVTAVLKPPLVYHRFVKQATPATWTNMRSGLWRNRRSNAGQDPARYDMDVVCPDGIAVRVITTVNQTSLVDISVIFSPLVTGAQRLKNSAAAAQATRTTPILQ